jgi:hypothetical protein
MDTNHGNVMHALCQALLSCFEITVSCGTTSFTGTGA